MPATAERPMTEGQTIGTKKIICLEMLYTEAYRCYLLQRPPFLDFQAQESHRELWEGCESGGHGHWGDYRSSTLGTHRPLDPLSSVNLKKGMSQIFSSFSQEQLTLQLIIGKQKTDFPGGQGKRAVSYFSQRSRARQEGETSL